MSKPNEQGDKPAETDESKVENTDAEQPKDDSEQGDKPADEQPEDEAKETDESKDEAGADLPDWAREQLTKARGEAANYRVRAREAEEKLKNAKTLEEVDQIVTEMARDREQTERALLIENVALRHKLPDELAELLKGETREELDAHAAILRKFAPTEDDDEDIDLEGGLSPRNADPEANLSPRELAARFGRGSKRRR